MGCRSAAEYAGRGADRRGRALGRCERRSETAEERRTFEERDRIEGRESPEARALPIRPRSPMRPAVPGPRARGVPVPVACLPRPSCRTVSRGTLSQVRPGPEGRDAALGENAHEYRTRTRSSQRDSWEPRLGTWRIGHSVLHGVNLQDRRARVAPGPLEGGGAGPYERPAAPSRQTVPGIAGSARERLAARRRCGRGTSRAASRARHVRGQRGRGRGGTRTPRARPGTVLADARRP